MINADCTLEDVEYRNFIKWYYDNKKRLFESEMEEIILSLKNKVQEEYELLV